MRVHTKLKMEWSGSEYITVHEEGYDYCPENGLTLCKGADTTQTDLNNSQSQFYTTMTNDYNQQFASQNAILSSLTNALSPTIAAGANQYGYSAAQTNNLNSSAIQGTAQSYQNAQQSLQNQAAAQGGGNAYLPSGVSAQNSAALAASGANQTSSELLGIQNAGYAQGNANYNNAVSALGGVASQYNPTGYSGAATSAGTSAANEANTINQENTAASPWSTIGGLLGGVASGVTSGLTGGLGTAVSTMGSGNFGW